MQAQAPVNAGEGKTRGPRGRKDKEGQESVIKTTVLKGQIEDLVSLHHKAANAMRVYGEAIKGAAEKSGLLATTVRKFIAARAGENFEEQKTKYTQLALVFDEIGED
jgi:hypothetical protein